MAEKPVLCSRITLCLLFAISGALSISLVQVPRSPIAMRVKRGTAQDILSAYFLGMKIANRVYNISLQDQNSQYYKTLHEEVVQVLNGVFACPRSCSTVKTYAGVGAMTFSNGSVIANSTLLFTTTLINEIVVKNLFLNSLINSPPIGLVVNLTYTVMMPPSPAPLPSETTTPLPKTTDSLLTRTSSVRKTSNAKTQNSQDTTNTPLSHTIYTSTISGPISAHPSSSLKTMHPASSTKRSSSNTVGPIVTQPNKHPNTTEPNNDVTASSSTSGGVPGWGIALLVLASVILLLLIVLLILLIWRWCCHQNEKRSKKTTQMRDGNQNPYGKHNPQPSAPELTVPVDQAYQEDFEKPKKNRTGMYIVNY